MTLELLTADSDMVFAAELVNAVISGMSIFGAGWYAEVQRLSAAQPVIGALVYDVSVGVWKALSPRERRELHRRAKRARPRRRLGRVRP